MIPFLEKYIPGNPNIVTEYARRRRSNSGKHMYAVARPDGLTIGSGTGSIITNGILDNLGVRYQLDKFIYLGSPRTETQQIFVTRRDARLGSLEKLRTIPGIGDQSVGFTTYVDARLFAYLIGLKEPKFVVGYSGREVDLALIHGEVDARSTPIHNILTRNRDWVKKKLVDFHAAIEFPKGEKHPQFPNLPDLETFAKSEKEHNLLKMHRSFRLVGAPFFLPPGTPRDRVQILREAMRKTFNDPEFHAYYKKLVGNEAVPITGEMQEKALRELSRDPEVVDLMKKITGADPLPLR
jgi:tripartite-type tricarboxylate transporter receptor subunit TctC